MSQPYFPNKRSGHGAGGPDDIPGYPRECERYTYKQATVFAKAFPGTLLSLRSVCSIRPSDAKTSSRQQDPSKSHRAVSVKPFRAMPGPKGLPFIGTTLEWMRSGKMFKMSEMIQERVERYGTIYREKMFPGFPEQVVITDPQDVATVFGADGEWPYRQFGGDTQILVNKKAKIPNGLFTSQGKEWHDLRQPIQKFVMVPSRVGQYHSDFNLITEDLMNIINTTRDSETKEFHDVTKLLFRWSFESASLFLLGKRLGSLDEQLPPDTAELFHWMRKFLQALLEISFSPPTHKLGWESKAMKASIETQKNFFRITQKYIKDRLSEIEAQDKHVLEESKEGLAKVDFLTSLMHSGKLDMIHVTEMVGTMLGAAFETTSFTLAWCLYLLATNTEKQEKLRSEVTSVLGSERMVTPTHINEMQYLRYCIKETLRMYPVAGINQRRTQVDLVLSEYQVPAGKEIIMPQMVMGRLPQLFPEPDQFLPERWNKDNENTPNMFASLPFGFGPRMCAGRRIAELELHIALAQLVRKYQVEYLEETPMDYVQKFLIQPDRKLNLVFADIN